MTYRGLAQRVARMERLKAQSLPRVHIVWLEAGESWDRDLSALGVGDRVIVLPRKAASVEAWEQAVRQRWAKGSTPARTPPHTQ
jgi:hypothetical protein